ncbi:hypothetical protein JAAARDRAFT_86845, partial [Jaapia argillacea MUCL 33604]
DFEPDDQWKHSLRREIEANLGTMVADAKQELEDKLRAAPVDEDTRERLTRDHMQTMATIRRIAEEQFQAALERERQERLWASGQLAEGEWSEALKREQ